MEKRQGKSIEESVCQSAGKKAVICLTTDLSGFALFPLCCTVPGGKSQNSYASRKPIQNIWKDGVAYIHILIVFHALSFVPPCYNWANEIAYIAELTHST